MKLYDTVRVASLAMVAATCACAQAPPWDFEDGGFRGWAYFAQGENHADAISKFSVLEQFN